MEDKGIKRGVKIVGQIQLTSTAFRNFVILSPLLLSLIGQFEETGASGPLIRFLEIDPQTDNRDASTLPEHL